MPVFFYTKYFSQELYPVKLSPKTWHNQELELRYHPEGKDFVITNGKRCLRVRFMAPIQHFVSKQVTVLNLPCICPVWVATSS
jgi:hypothetical protein